MSIEAVILSVREGTDPRIFLGPLNGEGPGQKSLRIANRPCPPLSGLVGCQIWGPSEYVLLGNKIIADRLGCGSIRLR